jgi:hypothetical protein
MNFGILDSSSLGILIENINMRPKQVGTDDENPMEN